MSEQAQLASEFFNSSSQKKQYDGLGLAGLESLASTPQAVHQVSWRQAGTKLYPRLEMVAGDMDWFEDMKKRKEANTRLLLSTKDNVNFRLYITEMTEYDDPMYQRRLSKFLRCLDEKQTLHIHLGCGCYGNFPVYSYGSVIDAIQRTRGKIITHLNGRSSFSETILWIYGDERVISEFTTITFKGLQNYFENGFAEWRAYFETFFNRAMDIKLITKDEKEMLLTSNKTLNLTYRDIIDRLHAKADDDSTVVE